MNAPAPYRRGDLRRGKQCIVEFAAGGVAADVRVERVDKENRCSWYSVRLASANAGVTSRLVGVRRGGEVDELGTVEAGSGSMSSARFAVTTPRAGAYRAMFLEIYSDQLLLRVEAPRPPAVQTFRPLRFGAIVLAVGVAASCVGAVPLTLPQHARGVAASGAGSAGAGAAGASVAAPFAVLPKAIAPSAPARVLSFSARRDDAPGGGESVLASYLALGDRGTIALLDPAGTIVASAAFTRVGTVRLPVPRRFRLLPMTAQITVHRGATKAVSGIALLPNAVKPPPAAPSDALRSAETLSSAPASGIVSIEGRAVAGHPLKLRVQPQTSAMHVELQDSTGVTLAESEIAPGTRHAVLQLPFAAVRTSYLLALHYTRNGGEETDIRTVVAAPR
ncbi:MAG TPA: hypothetical protein VGX96_16665 [Candidatus Elarobacter sp.]|nr:hypothetical protein [Candidatus Elarobacter sp.]